MTLAIVVLSVLLLAVVCFAVWRLATSRGSSTGEGIASDTKNEQSAPIEPKSADDHILKVLVVDEGSEPVVDAKVWLYLAFDPRLEEKRRSFGVTDKEGRTALAVPKVWLKEPDSPLAFQVWIFRDSFSLVAQTVAIRDLLRSASIMVKLQKTSPQILRILSPDGKPILASVSLEQIPPVPESSWAYLPAEVRHQLTISTDENGFASLVGFPREGKAGIRVEADDVGVQKFDLDNEKSNSIRVQPTGRVEGEFRSERTEWLAEIPVKVFTHSDEDWARGSGEALITTDRDGKFIVQSIAAGQVDFRITVPSEWPVRPRWDANLEVLPGLTRKVEVRLEKAVRLIGSIQTKGRPVAHLPVGLNHGTDLAVREIVLTDEAGRFEAYVLAGKATIFPGLGYKPEDWGSTALTIPKDSSSYNMPPFQVVPPQ